MCFAFRVENCVFVVLAGKFALRLLREMRFCVMAGKTFLRF